ncbi:capsular polysaccharide biosynthesis protein [Thiocystis violacea]|uniref:capsular polysaccharide biosynthesis protein n=1 Tax=Thiocystis violacea TaxID=13725 RepID=UPI0019044B4E|nr:capsular polysaccharide biosynthesis protein [Thiocystis violacea]MBK1723531.1 beta-3-deoxy-D-manno-oct-2-ulosonic acid transferase [Thiocystis violacea]
MIGILSPGILKIPRLAVLLGEPIVSVHPFRAPAGLSAIAGWGRKRTAARARHYAQAHSLPYLALEDGFLRSVGLGSDDPPLSIVVDDRGIYYDATTPSRLDALIRQPLSAQQRQRASALQSAWQAARVSKYNHLPAHRARLSRPYVLVVDQTCGDPAIHLGSANAECFEQMLGRALAEHPESQILVKIHPDVFAGRRRGHFDPRALAGMERVRVLSQDVHPVSLIANAEAVYTVTSQMGFEALLWGRPVRTFGMPFYAGWGLTRDTLPAPAWRRPVELEQLIHAALIAYPRYLDPETGQACEVERLLSWMGLQRRMRERFPEPIRAIGFSAWKRPLLRQFLQGSQLGFAPSVSNAANGETLAVWGTAATLDGAETLRLEDGFLRSVGLGADLIRPLSWVVDRRGIYYDPSRPSDLEVILQTADFDTGLLARARTLRQRIVRAGLTKYNVGAAGWERPRAASRVVLVPGQVEADASIRRGAPGIRRNLDLLRQARRDNPSAYLIYKPHPDVLAGLRARGEAEEQAREWCDELVPDVPMGALLDQVDEVQVLTSLTGFEALLRGKQVVCHGQPFYAGWGLTTDQAPIDRRTRALTLDMLVAGVLILYPTYVSLTTGRFTTPERALDELLAWRTDGRGLPWWRQAVRPLLGWLARRRD